MASSRAPDLRRAPLWALLAWLACCATMLWLYRGGFPTLAFRDPDDAMRLVQIRDWIGGQGFYDVSQHRVNPPTGGPMHWSRIVDMPIAALILLLRPMIGVANAEIMACAMTPLLLLGGLGAALFVAARRVAGSGAGPGTGAGIALLSVMLLLTTPTILIQFTPLRIDHHGWQILMAAVALCGLLDPRPARGGIVAGLALAVWLQISSEGLPYVALFTAIMAIRQWMAQAQGPRFIAFVGVLGGMALTLLILLRGPQAVMDGRCDALSFVYIWPLVVLAVVTGGAAHLIGGATAGRRLLVAAVSGGAALATFLLTGGPCLSGDPFAALGPVAYKLWYLQVMEGRPIWEQSLALRGVILLPPLLGLSASLIAARQAHGEARMRWLALVLLLAGAILVAVMVMRAQSVAHVFALPGIAWLMARLFARAQASRTALVRVMGSAALMLLTPTGLCAAWVAVTARAEPDRVAGADCRAAHVLAPLRTLAPATLFAPLDMGPDILVQTSHDVVGTAHHRNAKGITAVIEGFVDTPDKARAVIGRTAASYVVTCDGLTEYRLYGEQNRGGLAAMMAKRSVPAWLEPLSTKGPLRLYRIRRE